MLLKFSVLLIAVISLPSFAEEPAKLYATGQKAYQDKDYVTALKYLFAYEQIMGEKLASDQKGKKQLEEAIAFSEKQVRVPTLRFRISKLNGEDSSMFAAVAGNSENALKGLSRGQLYELSAAHKAAAKIMENRAAAIQLQ